MALDLDDTLMPYRFASRVSTLRGELGRRRYGALRRRRAGRRRCDRALKTAWDAASAATPIGLRIDRASRGHQDLRRRVHRAVVRRCHRLPTPAGAVRHADLEPRPSHSCRTASPTRRRTSIANIDLNGLASILSPPGFRDGAAASRPELRAHLVGRAGTAHDPDRPVRHVARGLVREGGRRAPGADRHLKQVRRGHGAGLP